MHQIYQQALALQPELVEIRHFLHQNAEVGQQLPRTKAFVKEKLIQYGYCPQELAHSSLTATIQGSRPGKTILLRADMDALALQEQTGLPFQCNTGSMHGCGHDLHTTMLLGAAKLLKTHQTQLCGTVKLLFQEDEEGFTGAKSVIRDGILQDPAVDAAVALHVHSGAPSCTVLGALGPFMAGCTLFRIQVQGVGCHGAMPETGVDPINIAAHIYLSLQEIVAREVAAQDPCVLTIGKFSAGSAPNILPGTAVLEGTIRYKDQATGDRVFARIRQIAELCARSFQGEAIVTELASAPPLVNNEVLVREICSTVQQFADPQQIHLLNQGGMGSEDFAAFSSLIPVAYLLLGAGSRQENERYGKPMHNAGIVFNEDILSFGSAILAAGAMDWLEHHAQP